MRCGRVGFGRAVRVSSDKAGSGSLKGEVFIFGGVGTKLPYFISPSAGPPEGLLAPCMSMGGVFLICDMPGSSADLAESSDAGLESAPRGAGD